MHHHIEAPPVVEDLFHDALALGEVGNVGAESLKVRAVGGKGLGAARQVIVTDVCHPDPRARNAERSGDTPPQPARRTGDEGDSVLEKRHRPIPSCFAFSLVVHWVDDAAPFIRLLFRVPSTSCPGGDRLAPPTRGVDGAGPTGTSSEGAR